MYVSWVFADKLRMVMSSIMRWRSGEIGCVIGELLSLDCTKRAILADRRLPTDAIVRWSRPTGHDHYCNVRQSDPQIQHSQLDNWAADLRHRLPTAERFSATGRYGIFGDHSGLILAARITWPHFLVASAMS